MLRSSALALTTKQLCIVLQSMLHVGPCVAAPALFGEVNIVMLSPFFFERKCHRWF